MEKERLRHLAGLTEEFSQGAWDISMRKIEDEFVNLTDEAYGLPGEMREKVLATLEQASDTLATLRHFKG